MRGRKRLLALCYFIVVLLIGAWYSAFYADFGKNIVGGWGVLVIGLAAIGGSSACSGWKRGVDWCCALLTAAQVPPVCCWGVFMTRQFAGMPGWLGLTIHAVLFVWGLINIAGSIKGK